MPSRSRISVLLLIIASIVAQFCSAIPDAEVDAVNSLISLYDPANACGIAGWTSPFSAADPCSWPRVLCTNDSISFLDLSGCNFAGDVPDVSNFTNLLTLKLNNNKFTGSLPATMQQLKNLVTLDLSYNLLGGDVDAVLGALPALQFLIVTNNSFTGGLDFVVAASSPLVEFRGANNAFSVVLNFASTSPLQVFILDNNPSGSFGGAFQGASSNLIELSLQNTGIIGLPSMSAFSQLKKLNLANNTLAQTLPPTDWPATLEVLNLDYNLFYGQIPDEWATVMPALTHLSIAGNAIVGALPSSFANFPALTHLNLSGNKLVCPGHLPATLTTCDLSDNFLCPRVLNNGTSSCVVIGACASSAASCKSIDILESMCPVRPAEYAECNSATLLWELPTWRVAYGGALNVNITISGGSLTIPNGSGFTLGGNLIVGTEDMPGELILGLNAKISVSGSFSVANNSNVTLSLPAASTINWNQPNASSLIPVIAVSEFSVISDVNTSLIVDASNTISSSFPTLPVLTFAHGVNGTFASRKTIVPATLEQTFQKMGLMCSGYFLDWYNNHTVLQAAYSVANSTTFCTHFRQRVIPPPLPPRGFDVGAFIGSLFAVLVLAFVCFGAAMVANEDWHSILPYHDY